MTQLELRQEIAETVRKAMAEAGISDAALARATGVPRPTLRRKVAGERDFSFTELALVAVALNIPSADLFNIAAASSGSAA